ncbi:hypothetical protein T02_9279 [Trichinella nativa]|uniref:Uncharacterized protein n=1 Tax=Trichinella nativa TaxID=6335 RepID=A0A0V1KQD0_9BILA|nr:hypothetical protein T02_9279 [Trichinella nativa]
MHTNSNVNAVLKFAYHAHNCNPYSNILHKIKKYNLKRGAAEEKKLILQIYTSSISANLKLPVARQKDFPCGQQLKIPAVSQKASKKFESYLNILSGVFDSCFKITPEWYQQMFTIHDFLEKFESYLNILSGVLIAALKLLLNGTSRCSPFMRHSYMLFVLQLLKR